MIVRVCALVHFRWQVRTWIAQLHVALAHLAIET